MFCPNCGADNDDDAKICQRCGFDIEHYDAMANVNFDYSFDDEEDEPKESFIKRNKKLVIGVIVIIIFFAIAYAGMSYLTQTPYKEININGMSMEVPDNDKVNVNVNSSSYSTYIDKKYGFEVYVFDNSALSMNNIDEATEFGSAKKISTTYVTPVEVDNILLNKSSYEVYSYSFKHGSKDILIYSGSSEYVAHAVKTLKMGNSSLAVSTSNSTIASNVSSNTSSNISSSSNVATENTVNNTNTANVPYANGPIKIQKLSISTAREIEALTYIKMYVGTQFAGKAVKVSSVFSNKNNVMCEETILTETVSSDGYVNFASTKAFAKFPDHGIIKVYNADGTLSDSKEITIVPRAGTQNF